MMERSWSTDTLLDAAHRLQRETISSIERIKRYLIVYLSSIIFFHFSYDTIRHISESDDIQAEAIMKLKEQNFQQVT